MLFVAWLYHHVFHCCRRIENVLFSPEKKAEKYVAVSSLPWLWVGAKNENGLVTDYTNDVNENVEYGVRVSTEWLNEVFVVKNVTWRYLDPKTLEEHDFPSSGFVIDDPVKQHPEDSADE